MRNYDSIKETLINSEFPRTTDGALADQAHKRLIRREWTQAWPESTTSEPHQDGVVQTFLNNKNGVLMPIKYRPRIEEEYERPVSMMIQNAVGMDNIPIKNPSYNACRSRPNMRTPFALAYAVLSACLAVTACASSPVVEKPRTNFSGSWSVQWCDKTDQDADCGGFDVTLTQVGDMITGDSFGARARLAQIDEGGVIHGVAVDSTAILTIESLRSGGIYLIEATVDGRCMRWKMRDTVRKAEHDIDIIAMDDVLTKKISMPSNKGEDGNSGVDCRGIQIRAQD
jgi:hypothetical protein